MRTLHRDMRYAPGETDVGTPLMEVLEKRHGVCQDFRTSDDRLPALARAGGPLCQRLHARAVRGKAEALVGGGASHAWVAVYSPPFGWIELDPTNNAGWESSTWPSHGGVISGMSRHLRGIILGGGSHELSVGVKVEAIA